MIYNCLIIGQAKRGFCHMAQVDTATYALNSSQLAFDLLYVWLELIK